MANKDLIEKNYSENSIYNPESLEYKLLIKELIRLDIPILEIGSSSIGKSYSIRQFAEEAGVNYEFLFVGTEKSEFIEGIPNLKGVTSGVAKFEYLKPYWFPDKEKIRSRLIRGKQMLEDLVDSDSNIANLYNNAFGDSGNYQYLIQLKNSLLGFKRTEEKSKKEGEQKLSKYIYDDTLLYLSTIEGYGNFWLILDEIDKVEKQDKDKYAPLLHIVRERELKGWKLSGLRSYPEYDIKFVTTVTIRKERLDAALSDPNVDVTDTRIIAIANDLQVMQSEAPALYRRFVKMIILRSLYDEKKISLPSGDSSIPVGYDWAAQYEINRQQLHSCIVKKEIKTDGSGLGRSGVVANKKSMSIGDLMAIIEDEKTGEPLEEMNLQWTLGFLPEILFPGTDVKQASEGFLSNYLIEDFNREQNPYKTLICKIIQDNFDKSYWIPLLNCIYDEVSIKKTDKGSKRELTDDVQEWYDEIDLVQSNYENPNEQKVESGLIDRYAKKLNRIIDKYKYNLEIQKSDDNKITDELSGVEGSLAKLSVDSVVFGVELMKNSIKDGNKTKLTEMLFSSIPFLINKFMYNSPYIPFESAKDLSEVYESQMIDFLKLISNKSTDLKDNMESAVKQLTPYTKFIVKYGMSIPNEYIDDVLEGNYTKIKANYEEVIKKIIQNQPVLVEKNIMNLAIANGELQIKYLESTSNIKLLNKEVYNNLPLYTWQLIKNQYKNFGLKEKLVSDIYGFCKKYPNTMITLAKSLSSGDEMELKEYIEKEANFVIKNYEDDISEIDKIHSI